MTSSSPHPPPPVLFVRNAHLLARIREEITRPPDPAVLPWKPAPEYDASAVAVRVRLDRAAREKRTAPAALPRPQGPARVGSAFARPEPPRTEPPRTEVPRTEPAAGTGPVDFSTAGSFFRKAEVATPASTRKTDPPPAPEAPAKPAEDERPAFGVAQAGGRSGSARRKEDEKDKKRKPRMVEDNILDRLKTEWLPTDEK